MPDNTQEKEMQATLATLRPDGAPWTLVQDWTDMADTHDPIVQEQIWKHAETDELMKNQRARP